MRGKVPGTESSLGDKKDSTRDAVFYCYILIFFDAPDGDGSWGEMDFSKPVKISHFYYYAIEDGNTLAPSDKYELFYWDNSKSSRTGTKGNVTDTFI